MLTLHSSCLVNGCCIHDDIESNRDFRYFGSCLPGVRNLSLELPVFSTLWNDDGSWLSIPLGELHLGTNGLVHGCPTTVPSHLKPDG